uniref:Uncharacterized protein n=1 Tax=Rhizophora mucronata TaxID=61149 RepID=A0A2P2JBF4_RHIMU
MLFCRSHLNSHTPC